ncbi:hypothetical protein [Frankia sp. AgKG'84/4]|uniref:hypothetical protein n=1 Tax=Frankia sp. AgKG'84/4 TaxID=573490 RepID=UPI00200FD334|nr:hypothetical protein [Frankia sp. AgKG'84/4]MCL9798449.1 hypothetical protein [Frankia sp. AgKG'84/4]
MDSDEPAVIVSADCPAGASLLGFRDYLVRERHDDFDRWSREFMNPWQDLDELYADRNWDSAEELAVIAQTKAIADLLADRARRVGGLDAIDSYRFVADLPTSTAARIGPSSAEVLATA